RRLALSVEGLSAASKAVREERKGPAITAPDQAVEGFLRSTGLSRDQLEVREVGKGQAYFAVIEKPGRAAAEIIAEVLEHTIRNFPWPKSMRWGAGSLRWVRPLHSIICLLTDEGGATVVPLEIDGITAGNTTRGHRFLSKGDIKVSGFEDYEAKLKKAHVILRADERAATIWHDATNQAFANGLEVVEDKGLLAEVSGLVEWPVVLSGKIGEAFLGLPPEVLQTSMKEHQKFFSVRNPRSGRIEGFVTVANTETADHGATILKGNQKVLSARLSDARFFYENDLRVAKAGMGDWLDGLANVTFHNKLGSQRDRIDRIAALAREIAPKVGADAAQAEEAAGLAKADLRSAMVGEFPELQGVMGRYYALAAGRLPEVADAARDHYSPLGPSDDVPTAPVSVAVALADKLDTLTGFWAIDEKPTGSKDPFALRRAALGVIRLVLANDLRLHLDRLIDTQILRHKTAGNGDKKSAALLDAVLDEIADHGVFGAAVRAIIDKIEGDAPDWVQMVTLHTPDLSDNLIEFFHDRLKVFLRDEGIRHDVIDACLAMPGSDDLTLLVKRARALSGFMRTEDGENLIQGYKRANNILTQAEEKDGVEYSYGADAKFAEGDEEKALFAALDKAEAEIAPAMKTENFGAAMAAMAALRAPIDAFFTAVQVNSDNQVVRRNRLNLLSRIRSICLSVADLNRIEG
ncbi:MAG TPA: glycine--tRNA ligase subunit beta, partial [Paracoccaceae bacterium]|nr:glycine--tRNA ligase subunit beta [Paracoccaceae bacterium]